MNKKDWLKSVQLDCLHHQFLYISDTVHDKFIITLLGYVWTNNTSDLLPQDMRSCVAVTSPSNSYGKGPSSPEL